MAPINTAASAQDLLQNNEKYAESHQPQPFLEEILPAKEPSPVPKTFICEPVLTENILCVQSHPN